MFKSLGEAKAYAEEQTALRKREDEKERRAFKHDWRIVVFSTIGGGLMGLITSVIFWLLTK